jgi:hypothetical protein
MSEASRSIWMLRAFASLTRSAVRPMTSASSPRAVRIASMTQVFAPAKLCCGTSGRLNHGSPKSAKTQPPPYWSGMWQSWQDFMGPVGWFPPKRRSGK